MRQLRARRGAAWIAAGSAAILACLAACAGPAAIPRPGAAGLGRAGAITAQANLTATTAAPVPTSVVRGGARGPAHGTTPKPAASPPSPCPPLPKGGLKLNKRFPLPKPPPHSSVSYPPPEPGCAYIVGYADVRKQNGAALVGPGLVNLSVGVRVVLNLGHNYFEQDTAGQLDYRPCRTCQFMHALPPARATFLAFGIVPVSATLQLTEIGTMNIFQVGTLAVLKSNTAWSLMSLRISDVTVNGRPLNVGLHCQTARPLLVKLVGLDAGPQPYSLQQGGPLTGQITIPPFSGCGVTENLDPLFTGTVSGPGNFAKFTQGVLCTPIGDEGCPPRIPKPLR